MKLFNYKKNINAPIEIVYGCLVDIEYFKEEIHIADKDSGKNIRINYDHENLFGVGKKIAIKIDNMLKTLEVVENKPPNTLTLKYHPGKRLKYLLGEAYLYNNLEKDGNTTKYHLGVFSERQAKGFWKLFIILIAFFFKISCRGATKRLVRRIEEANERA